MSLQPTEHSKAPPRIDEAYNSAEDGSPDFADSDELQDEEIEEEDEQYFSGMNEVMDQDWDILDGDLTKRFNRLKAHVNASMAQQSVLPQQRQTQANSGSDDVFVRPAINTNAKSGRGDADSTVNGSATRTNKVSEQLAHYAKYAASINLDILQGPAGNVTRKGGSERTLNKDKSDRATNEQVLDPRTRLILFKMLGRGLISRIDGCVSTGKEANVYHSVSPEGRHIALKIFKTSILVFKDRDRYVTGEFRFKSGYARSNPRKMVRLWAEKELRNLRRMRTAGLLVPEAIEVRENVLVMDFLGESEWQASPRLKDASIPTERFDDVYFEMLILARKIYAHCKLVHADLSEYNVLWHDEKLWVIDVSQSVEHDHPAALDFLRSDLKNIDDFWAKRGVRTLGLTTSFNFVTSNPSRLLADDEYVALVRELLDVENTARHGEDQRQVDEAVFAKSYIPTTLNEVVDPERDVAVLNEGGGDKLIYAKLTGLDTAGNAAASEETSGEGKTLVRQSDQVAEEKDDSVEDNDSSSSDDDDEDEDEDDNDDDSAGDEEGEEGEKRPKGKKFEDKEEKKQRKREAKEKAREKRSKKMPKAEKARRVKKSSGKR